MPLYIVMENGYLMNEYSNLQDAMNRMSDLQKRYREEIDDGDRINMPPLYVYQLVGVAS